MFLKTTDVGRLILEAVAANGPAHTKTAGAVFARADAVKIAEGLTKTASSPYEKGAYERTQEMMKTASTCITALVNGLEESESKIRSLEKAASIRSVLDSMVASGLTDDSDVMDKIAQLSKKSDHELEIVKEAVKLASGSRASNIFFDQNEAGSAGAEKRGMFDDVIGGGENS